MAKVAQLYQTQTPVVQPTSGVPVWPIPGDVPPVEAIIQDQAAVIEDQEALLHDYQGVLNAAQNPAPGTAAAGTGAITTASTSLSVSGVTGANIVVGATVNDATVPTPLTPPGTIVLGQISGTTGSGGVYLLNKAVTYPATIALTFTPPPSASTWPTPTDAPTLMLIQQQQTAVLRMQSSLIQAYQDLLNVSQTAAPPTGP